MCEVDCTEWAIRGNARVIISVTPGPSFGDARALSSHRWSRRAVPNQTEPFDAWLANPDQIEC
jgi:hypothetical protein